MYNLTMDMECWMTNLPKKLKSIPITQLAIPGSHNSITYDITEKSDVAPDNHPIIPYLKKFVEFFSGRVEPYIVPWSKNQDLNILQQLKSGIRYFDFRIATNEKSDDFYFVHGLYSTVDVKKVLEELKSFLKTHKEEVVILDCHHFYAFQKNDHRRLMGLITSTFNNPDLNSNSDSNQKIIVPRASDMKHLSLEYMTTKSYQVIIIYRDKACKSGQPLFWPESSFKTDWPKKMEPSELITFLDKKLTERDDSVGLVSQCILSPSEELTLTNVHIYASTSVKEHCFTPLQEEKYKCLEKQKP